ncbi:MAG: glutamate synthase large subunit, partial [Acidobacteriota bacterium]
MVEKGRLGPGQMLVIDLEQGKVEHDLALKKRLGQERPYRRWLDGELALPPACARDRVHALEPERQRALELAFGYTKEAFTFILDPMAQGKLPVGSMGNDAPLALLSKQPQLLFSYFRQRFAQVTNPPIDPLRERLVFDLDSVAGGVGNLLGGDEAAAHLVRFPSPVLSSPQLDWLLSLEDPAFRHRVLDLTWDRQDDSALAGERLKEAVDALADRAVEAARGGVPILVLSDRGLDREHPTIPILLATAAVHSRLVAAQERMRVTLVCDTAEPREDHHVACLLGFGATLVHPYLAYSAVAGRADSLGLTPEDAVVRYRLTLDQGLLKILSRLGVCPMLSYHGAQLFEILGLDRDLIDDYFPGTPNRLGGASLAHLAADVETLHRSAFEGSELPDRGLFRYRRGGEHHDLQPKAFTALHKAVRRQDAASFGRYTEALDNCQPSRLRHLLDWKPLGPPVPISEVEEPGVIARRFATAAMSLGALSREAHEALAVAMNRLGGRSNSGEGGEDPVRFTPYCSVTAPKFLSVWKPESGDLAASAIKQIASGRFGVTAHYLVSAQELEIKMAQGSKPGEGGQIPAHKVTDEIARLRRSTPGVALISPPPHHDIYSIEDLAQLVHDLKRVNGEARLGVKLVSLAGVGTIACGVAKAHADYILISGDDGGTGASPLSSIKHAGMPWELGLAETQQQLVANGLRHKVTLRVDGGLRTGRDVVAAALLGAEEFGFGTAPLIALGCVMARRCHNNTCPVGIATQREKLRARFPGDPEHVVSFLTYVAMEVREIMAAMGARRIDQLIGRFDLLVRRADLEDPEIGRHLLELCRDPDPIGVRPRRRRQLRNDSTRPAGLDQRLAEDAAPLLEQGQPLAPLEYPINSRDRTVGARLAGQIARATAGQGLPPASVQARFRGSAGQSFGAFLVEGMDLHLEGEAQDGVGKGMSGGRLVLRPQEVSRLESQDHVIAGNALLYGATGGELFAAGRVGERFCVRNSGALAVVEGCGDHGCEYMTGGFAVILGPIGRNFGAGMTGGRAFLYDPDEAA